MILEIRPCSDIGMFAIDRPRTSCLHASKFCAATCYNRSIEARFRKSIPAKDIRNELSWQTITGTALAETLDRKRTFTGRIRLMTRGEALSDISDIDRVRDIARANPSRLIWVPTRAWRNPIMRALIQSTLFPIRNLRILASTDPSTSATEDADLASDGWGTMFFGDDTADQTKAGRPMFRCPKTWRHKTGHCEICKRGCFNSKTRVDVHLKRH